MGKETGEYQEIMGTRTMEDYARTSYPLGDGLQRDPLTTYLKRPSPQPYDEPKETKAPNGFLKTILFDLNKQILLDIMIAVFFGVVFYIFYHQPSFKFN